MGAEAGEGRAEGADTTRGQPGGRARERGPVTNQPPPVRGAGGRVGAAIGVQVGVGLGEGGSACAGSDVNRVMRVAARTAVSRAARSRAHPRSR
ncbi:hypothetical protein CLM82_25285 [Streptomyces albidoflavus]|nr:hypothetical protein CLM82_25285 [Streptomyces albidoflavus]